MIRSRTEAGAALLSILLIVATLSVAALIAMQAIVKQTELHKLGSRHSAAIWSARSAEAAALTSAGDLRAGSRLPVQNAGDVRTQTVALPVEGGQVILTIGELPACLNLNALGNQDEAVRLQQAEALLVLFEELGVPEGDASGLIAGVSDWIDADSETQPAGAESDFYLSSANGFRAGNQPMLSVAELRTIPGFDEDMARTASVHTCVIPETSPGAINVNALSADDAVVIRAASRGQISLGEASKFIEARPDKGWANLQEVSEFTAQRPALAQALAGVSLSVQSSYFLAEGRVQLDTGDWPFRFLMRSGDDGSRVVWRSFGDSE